MSTLSHATPVGLAAFHPTPLPTGPILVATDTGPNSDAAVPVAAALAARTHADVIALTVVEPTTMPIYGVAGMVIAMDSDEDVLSARESAAHAQVTRLASPEARWPVVVRSGQPARETAGMADALRAQLIITGRGRHVGLDRIVGSETVLRLLQLGDTPVLAVEESLTSLPRRVVIACDFSVFSQYAAQVAFSLVAPDAHVWLVHVGPPFDESVPFLKARADVYREQADAAFSQLRSQLTSGVLTVESEVLTGLAPDQLLKCVAQHHADLVVCATHGYGFVRRMVMGSVAATLVRRAPCSVLSVPGSARTVAAARARAIPNSTTRPFVRSVIEQELADFTLRNRGRRCTVEVDRDEFGAQVLGHDLQLVGAHFDRHGNRLTLMFGASTLSGLHLTHSSGGVIVVDLSTNAAGKDQVLRIVQPEGQTLVSLA
jgi:nucleotide-binding universal stress UspA family protein